MSSDRLRMNADKTQLIWLGTKQQLDELSMTELDLLSARVRFSTAVSDLGVLVDSQRSMADHVASLSRTCLFQLRQLRLMRSSLNEESVHCIYCILYCTRHSCTRSSAAVSTTATACCTVSATSCCRSYRSFRTRPHEW